MLAITITTDVTKNLNDKRLVRVFNFCDGTIAVALYLCVFNIST